MKTKKEYYNALRSGDISLIGELVVEAGYNKIDLSALNGFKEVYSIAESVEKKFKETGELPQSHSILGVGLAAGCSEEYAPINFLKAFNEGIFAVNRDGYFVAGGKVPYSDIPKWNCPRHYFVENTRGVIYRGRLGTKLENTSELFDELLRFEAKKYSRIMSGVMIAAIGTCVLCLGINEFEPLQNILKTYTSAPATISILPMLTIPIITGFNLSSNYGKSLVKKLMKKAKRR